MPGPAVALSNQWNDLLLRKVDPYASSKYEILLDWLGDLKGRDALVMGCGSGELVALLVKAGARVKAVDLDPGAVELTRETARRFGIEVTTEVSSLEAYTTDERYDLVVATDVIEHIADDLKASTKLVQLARPQGTVVITVPAFPFLFGYHDEALGHYRRYRYRSLKSLFDPLIAIDKMRYYGFFLVPVALLISRILRRPYPVAAVGTAEQGRGILGAFIRFFFRWEKVVSPPLGTSLLLMGRPRPAENP